MDLSFSKQGGPPIPPKDPKERSYTSNFKDLWTRYHELLTFCESWPTAAEYLDRATGFRQGFANKNFLMLSKAMRIYNNLLAMHATPDGDKRTHENEQAYKNVFNKATGQWQMQFKSKGDEQAFGKAWNDFLNEPCVINI